MTLSRLLDRLFGKAEEINGGERCPTYLYRWKVLKLPKGVAVYLHRFVGDDWSRDLHDHPKRFVSIGLWGSYVEETPHVVMAALERGRAERVFRAPWIRTFPATHVHRLRLLRACGGCGAPEERPDQHKAGCYIPLMLPRPCWTLVIVLRAVRPWGFWHLGEWIPWRKYVGGEIADRMKSCE